MADFNQDLDNKIAQNDKNNKGEYDSIRSKTHATEKRIVQMDAGNQQLLEKLLGVEKDLNGKLQGVNENAKSLDTSSYHSTMTPRTPLKQLLTSKNLFSSTQSRYKRSTLKGSRMKLKPRKILHQLCLPMAKPSLTSNQSWRM